MSPRILAILALAAMASPARAGACTNTDIERFRSSAIEQSDEINQASRYYNALGCALEQGYDIVDECQAVLRDIDLMQQNLASITRRLRDSEQLFRSTCQTPAPQETLPESEHDAGVRPRISGEPVCVRLADGYFFPLAAPKSTPDEDAALCQAQCPATPTDVFYRAPGRDIETANDRQGNPYRSLANALLYRKVHVPDAECRYDNHDWKSSLAHARTLIKQNETDVDVTPELAESLSRPGARTTGHRGK